MTRTSRLTAHGLAVTLPAGWDGEIYRRDLEGEIGVVKPVVHVANFGLPTGRGDFGSGAVERMGRRGVLLSILEYDDRSAGTPLFANPFPRALTAREFATNTMQRAIPGQAGTQRFVTEAGRAFCVYAVIGSHALRKVLVPELNKVLATVEIS